MANRRKAADSSAAQAPVITTVVLSKTTHPLLSPSTSEKAAVPHSETPRGTSSSGEIDWKHAFQMLSHHLGAEMLSGDVFYFVGSGLQRSCGDEVARAFLIHARRTRTAFTDKFMG